MELIKPLSQIIQAPINPRIVRPPRWDNWGERIANARKHGIRFGNSRGAVGAGDRSYTFDANLGLSDGVLPITATGWAQYGGVPSLLDLGGNQGVTVTLPSIAVNQTYTPQQPRIDATIVIDVTQITVSSNVYRIIAVGSNSPAFTSSAWLGSMELGTGTSFDGYNANGPAFGSTTALAAGTSPGYVLELPFTNEQNLVKYEYVGLYVTCSGSTPSITFKAFVAVLPQP